MRHIVTGGLGFTGSHLVKRLAHSGESVVAFDIAEPAGPLPTGTRFVRGDIRDPACLQEIGLKRGDIVHHLAARQFHSYVPQRDRDRWFCEVNVEGTRNVLAAMASARARDLVFFSTDMVYGMPNQSPVQTDHPREPVGPYGRSKRAAEDLLSSYRDRGFRITIFRPRMIIGPGRLGILSKLFRLIEAGLPVPLIGSGSNRYQMVSVHDCVRADLHALRAGLPPGPFHLGSMNPPLVRELLKGVIDQAGSRSRLLPLPSRIVKATLSFLDQVGSTLLFPEQFMIADQDYVLDVSNTIKALAFTPKHDDRDMLISAYQEFLRLRPVETLCSSAQSSQFTDGMNFGQEPPKV